MVKNRKIFWRKLSYNLIPANCSAFHQYNSSTMQLNNFDGVIFDLDGTLWDASGTCTKAWNATLLQFGITGHVVNEGMIRSFSGMQIEKVFKEQFSFIPSDQRQDLLELYKINERKFMAEFGGELFPGVREGLAKIKENYNIFIVSNCLDGYIENFTDFTGLEKTFVDYESSGRTGLSKAENIGLIIERNNLKYPVYIGDTVWDKEAADKVNMPFIHAAYGFGKVDDVYQSIQRFADLHQLLSKTVS